jgi:cyanate permease
MKTPILAAALAALAGPALAHGGHVPVADHLHGLAHALILLGPLALIASAALARAWCPRHRRQRRADRAGPGNAP